MRIVTSCLTWVVAAVLCTALVIALLEAFALINNGTPTAQIFDRVLLTLGARAHFLAYAALAGLAIGLLSLVPSVMRANAEKLILWTILGAISGAISVACGVFLYKAYVLFSRGIAADELSLAALLVDEMKIHAFIPYGALAGAALAIVLVVVAMLRESEAREAAAAIARAHNNDPDSIIRAQRAHRAQQYLAERRQRDDIEVQSPT